MKIAIEGCCHGQLDAIYRQIGHLEQRNGYKVDLLLICGDFQAIRNPQDLSCMSVPNKYKQLGEFHKYYTGETKAPILTIVIGGNHEASNYFWELYHGGWIAPNMYFLGHAGCVQVNGIRIAGASGIFKANDFRQGHHERLPYNQGSMRSIYHIREYNVRRLSLLSRPDIFLSHDWPAGIEHHGNTGSLLKRKPFFREDIQKGALGSPPLLGLLHTLKPAWWFSAHLHVRFEALVTHAETLSSSDANQTSKATIPVPGANPDEISIDDDDLDETPNVAPSDTDGTFIVFEEQHNSPAQGNASTDDTLPTSANLSAFKSDLTSPHISPDPDTTTININRVNPDEITLEDEEEEVEVAITTASTGATASQAMNESAGSESVTRFLALDKCLPRREYLEVIDYSAQVEGPPTLSYDPEWLAITRAFNPLMSLTYAQPPFPEEKVARNMVAKEFQWVKESILVNKPNVSDVATKEVLDVQVFAPTAQGGNIGSQHGQPPYFPNPQTTAFCSMLQIENKVR